MKEDEDVVRNIQDSSDTRRGSDSQPGPPDQPPGKPKDFPGNPNPPGPPKDHPGNQRNHRVIPTGRVHQRISQDAEILHPVA